MNTPKISVIVPCYNVEAFLPHCLEHLLSQTIEDFEAICIDDGSLDRTGVLLDQAQKADVRIHAIHQDNKGVSVSRNLGISLAKGEYVAFLDPDDFYPDNNTLALLYSKAKEHNALICGGSFSNYLEPSGKVTLCYTGDYAGYTFRKEGFLHYRDYQFDFGFHRFLYHREFLLQHSLQFPPYARFQDPPFFVQVMILAERFYALPQVVYRYRIGIQDQAVSWPAAKLHDMIQGHLDVLHLSRNHSLAQLHTLTVRRFDSNSIYQAVRNSLLEGDSRTAELVTQFQSAIDPSILPDYTLRVLRSDEEPSTGASVMRKIRTLFSFLRDNGLRRTILLLRETLEK